MSDANPLSLFWEGFCVQSYENDDQQRLTLHLTPQQPDLACCSGCRQCLLAIHDTTIRTIRDRDLLDQQVWLKVPVRRVRCPNCGPRLEYIPWLARHQRLTRRLVNWVERLAQLLPIQHVAKLVGLNWHTIKAIDYKRMQRELKEPDRAQIRRLVMDEFALFKGHRYATVVINADNQQVLWVGEGRSRKDIQPFFTWLGEAACRRIEAVAMDMNTAMDLEVQHHCPNARVVYDLFHVVAKFGREVVDRVRVDQANKLRGNKPARKVIKRSRWLLLRNHSNLSPEHALKLDELLQANQPLMTVYLLKNQLKELWFAPSEAHARQRWKEWYDMAMTSGISCVQNFARRLKGYTEGIVASALYPMNTSVLEGMNNKIKVIKRMAYGYRDNDYFFLKIKSAFPGKVR